MKIGFDIDDTLINLREHAFQIYKKKLGKNVGIEHFHQLKRVEIHEVFGLDDIEGKKMWNSLLEEIYFTNCPAFDGAIEFVNELYRQGHSIFYITSRPKKYCEKTRQWMKEKGFPVIDNQFYCGMEDGEKIDIIKQLDLDIYFDDKPAVLSTLKNTKTKIYIKDQSYNQGISYPRVFDWMKFQI
ncbi:5' nucleotidase, NT5C type [Ureibacillus thermosphaericus]|uniref:5' nucleotidase, NT5C type n=1 Tax=Ureibacillus thermosphaericus TaxID=51173 RepID=UPI0016AB6E84|nr:HAD hydrolase-like protein [Lysinibacillus sp.]